MIDLDTDLTVYAGSLEFRGGHGDDGFFIWPEGFVDGVGSNADAVSLPAGGSSDVAPRLADRLLTLRGRCWARSPLELRDYGMRLSALGADGKRFKVTVVQDGLSLWAWARRAPSPPKFDASPAFGRADFQVSFWFPNPRQFGRVRLSSPAANVDDVLLNQGTFEAAPRFSVWGPQPLGYSIVAPGLPTYQVDTPLEAGLNDVIDFATGIVMRNGVQLVGAVPFPGTWKVPAAGSQVWRFVPTGNGPITAEVTDTYIGI